MIGEIGLSASVNYSIDSGNMDGSLADQTGFASYTLNAARNCGASGYTWAGYQDVENNSFVSPSFSSDFLGLIERYQVPSPLAEKPAVDTFRYWNYVKNNCPACYSLIYDTASLYYNPFSHPTFDSVAAGFIKTAYVVDQDNNPITDAYIGSMTWMRGRNTPFYYDDDLTDYHYTFTDENGFYTIIPYDYFDIINDSAFVLSIDLFAAGAESKRFSFWDFNLPPNYSQISLNKIDYNYHGVVSNITITSGNDQTFKGYYSLTVQDVTIQNYASADFYADYLVHIKPGFTALKGSNARLFCADTAYFCSDYLWNDGINKSDILMAEQIPKTEIVLQFKIVEQSQNISIYPNPGNGWVTIKIYDISEDDDYFIRVTNILGSSIYYSQMESNEINIDLSSYPKGMYFINVKNQIESFVKKIIIQ
jgi:hypothetical protein